MLMYFIFQNYVVWSQNNFITIDQYLFDILDFGGFEKKFYSILSYWRSVMNYDFRFFLGRFIPSYRKKTWSDTCNMPNGFIFTITVYVGKDSLKN